MERLTSNGINPIESDSTGRSSQLCKIIGYSCKNRHGYVSIVSYGSFYIPRAEEKMANRAWALLSITVSLCIAVAIIAGCLKLPWEFALCLAFVVVITAELIQRYRPNYQKLSSLITIALIFGFILRVVYTFFLK